MCQAMDSLLRPVSKGPTATRRPPSVDACRGPGTLGPWDPGTLGMAWHGDLSRSSIELEL